MTTILDFQIRSTTPEHYRLDVLVRGQEQPLATAAFDYPLSFLTGFELNRLDFEGKDPVGRFAGHGIAPVDGGDAAGRWDYYCQTDCSPAALENRTR
jgi:hypothetical protein